MSFVDPLCFMVLGQAHLHLLRFHTKNGDKRLFPDEDVGEVYIR